MNTKLFFGCCLVLVWICCMTNCVYTTEIKNGNIEVELKSTWKKTSLIAEASEFIADWFNESESKFWQFFELAAKEAHQFSTDKQAYEWISTTSENVFQFSSSIKQLLDFALSTHYFSPKIEALHQLAAPFLKENSSIGDNFVVVQHLKDSDAPVSLLTTIEQVENYLKTGSLPQQKPSTMSVMEVLPFDHVYAANEKASRRFYLFANIHSQDSLTLHNLLKQASDAEYVLRFFDKQSFSIERKDSISNPDSEKLLSLQGYAVELQIKNMEYKQMDISILEHKQHQDNTTTPEKIAKEKPFDVESIKKNFGVKAAQVISTAGQEGFLARLIDISQNVPQKLKLIQNTEISYDLDVELRQNSNAIPPGRTFFSLSGNGLDYEKLTLFSLLDLLKAEYNLYDTLTNLGVNSELLQTLLFKEATTEGVHRFQLFDDKERAKNLVTFLNDIEKDARYKEFPKKLTTMLEPTAFGQMRFVRRNLIQAIVVADPSEMFSMHMLSFVYNMYQRGYPVQIGFMFAGSLEAQKVAAYLASNPQYVDLSMTGDSQTMKKAPLDLSSFYQDSVAAKVYCGLEYLKNTVDAQRPVSYIGAVLQRANMEGFTIAVMDRVFRDFTGSSLANEVTDSCLAKFHEANLFIVEKGLQDKVPFLLMNGALNSFQNTNIQQSFFTSMNAEYENILELIKNKVIQDEDVNLIDKILESQHAFKKYNPNIFTSDKEITFVSLLELPPLKFIDENPSSPRALSHILAVDLNQKKGRKTLLSALKYVQSTTQGRLAVVHISPKASAQTLSLIKSFDNDNIASTIALVSSLIDQEEDTKMLDSEPSEARDYLIKNIVSEADYVIANGRVVIISDSFELDDFLMLEALESVRTSEYAKKIIATESIAEGQKSNLIMLVASVLNVYGSKHGTKHNVRPNFGGSKTVFRYNQEKLGTAPEFIAAVNPLSEETAKFASLLDLVVNFFKLPTTIILNPSVEESKDNVLIKRWYRFNIRPQLEFDDEGREKPVKTTFENFKSSPSILTLNMHVPETWLVESTYAVDDLDNINLEKSFAKKDKVSARYQLENIIISGSCLDAKSSSSTRGLQLILGDLQEKHVKDTLVMANFGYYQLKANPNSWEIRIAPGSHSDIYEMVDYSTKSFYSQKQQTSLVPVDKDQKIRVFVTSFDGPFVVLRVEKKPGMENVDLANVNTNSGSSLWQSMFGKKNQDTINVFSIASGHMYERLLKIMILSVIRNTKQKPVKFWLIKNYFSPQFKEFLPHMAKKYKFEYEFVTYKWPHWLHKQVEKQRLIWAYKILFLDVLFPINVDKVIYIDADQVTRADMSELWDMDLQGSPVGYTPFCDDKPEMDGYRFWKQGYWQSHLRGKNYHISALYVVDIQRLRQVFGGDQYRLYYDNLSKDPGSLSNLDQDLPNYSQHAVSIFSLPQDWLWCESWCSDTAKSKAKTIDLCNNPMTKEHKLESAKRIIPEWVDYDKEAQKLAEELYEQGLLNYTV